jgi:ABC-2 type transport system ATP-binding protein
MNEEPVIDVRGITKRFGDKTVVNGVDISVRRGEIYGFLGPNGSGKTTFIRVLCGLLKADGGGGTCLGYDVLTQSDEIKLHVGYMTQKFSLYQDLSIEENLDFMARVYSMPGRRQVVAAALERLGLANRKEQLAGQLSGGWKQRLALAAALLHKPQLLLLDEPTAGVDPKARRDFWLEIHKLAQEGLTVLVSTHYMDEAEQCDRLAYLAYGNLMVNGTVAEVVANSGLHTYCVTGGDMQKLVSLLDGKYPGLQVVPFGIKLHVFSRDAALLERVAAEYAKDDWQWEKSEPALEDVFIELMNRAKDNYA